jgi:Ca2+-binding RTX toxin-like protein
MLYLATECWEVGMATWDAATRTWTLELDDFNFIIPGAGVANVVGNSEDNHLQGNGDANLIEGRAGDDWLDGNGGADRLIGGSGDDVYFIDHAGDVVVETFNEGLNDRILASISYTLPSHVERLTLYEPGLRGTGNDLDNVIISSDEGSCLLEGAGGNDTLHGGPADTMIGGDGDDYYLAYGDFHVVEAANGGYDTVESNTDYTLGNFVENLVLEGFDNYQALRGTGNALDNHIKGDIGTNVLNGEAGDDTLEGGGGADTLVGGSGDDTFIADRHDSITEAARGGFDTVRSSFSYVLAPELEKLVLVGSDDLTGTGNNHANTIVGNAGDNLLSGGAGSDVLTGGRGKDSFRLDAARKRQVDEITDFNVKDDVFLIGAAFKAGRKGVLKRDAFTVGDRAKDAQERFIYDKKTGDLFYDRDGTGAAKPILVAELDRRLKLKHSDFLLE